MTRKLCVLILSTAMYVSAVGCGAAEMASPSSGRTLRAEPALIGPVASSKTLMELVSKPDVANRVIRGRVMAVTSFVNSDDEIYSHVDLTLVDGRAFRYLVYGGTVPARELKALTDPAIGEPATGAKLDEPVTMTFDGVLVPSVGQDIVMFYSDVDKNGSEQRGGLVLIVTPGPKGSTYSFSGEPLIKTWQAPASETELNRLIAAVKQAS